MEESSIARHFNGVRLVLRDKAKNLMYSGVASMLRFALLELMPEHECQRRLLPKLEIYIYDSFIVTFKMQLRKGQRRSQLEHDQKPALEELRLQIEELMVMREKLVHGRLFFDGTEPTIMPMIEALGNKIQRSARTR